MHDAAQASREAALQTLFDALKPLSLAPLWTQYRAMLTSTPQGKARPYLWRYADLRPHLLRSGLDDKFNLQREQFAFANPGALQLHQVFLSCHDDGAGRLTIGPSR